MTRTIMITATALAFAAVLPAAPAQAQRARVFVASYGSDSNPCTFGSPCKTFQNAVNMVAAGGEVTAIDSAGFQTVNINKAVTITSPAGIEAGIAAAGSNAVTIGAGPNDVVVLRGLTLDGAGSGNYGIYATSAAQVEIVDCSVRNFTQAAVYIQSSSPMSVEISNTSASDIPGGGSVAFYLISAGGTMTAALDHVTAHNVGYGVYAWASGSPLETTISNSHIDSVSSAGINVMGAGSGSVSYATLKNVVVDQAVEGVSVLNDATVWFSQVTLATAPGFGGAFGVFVSSNDAAAYTDGTNHLGDVTGAGTTAWNLQ